MPVQANRPEGTIEQLIDRIMHYRRINRADQERLMSVLLAKTMLSEAEHRQIDRVFDALRSGLVKVVD
jgi:hypothetical protein